MRYFLGVLCFLVSLSVKAQDTLSVDKCMYIGDSLMNTYNTFEALKWYQHAFAQEDRAIVRMKLANCYYQRMAYQQATNLLKVLPEDSLSHESLRQLVFGYHKLSDISSMVYWAEQTVIRYPMDAEMVAKLCSGFSQLNQPQNGIECALRYFEVDSTSIDVNRALENAYFMDLQFDKAAFIGERLLEQGDSVFNTFFLTGFSYLKLDSLTKTYDLLLKAATLNEFKNEACVSRLGSTCLKLERYEEGLHYLNIAKNLIYPDTMQMRSFTLSLAEACYMTQHPHEAIEAWKMHIDYNPTTVATYYNIANTYAYLLNDYEQAKVYYTRFLELAKTEDTPTPQLLEMIERAENMTRELPDDELEKLDMPVPELKPDTLIVDEISADSINVE